MERAKFLNLLQKELKSDFLRNEINEIIKDYNEYFDTGLSEGKSEQELCIEFGDPSFIASELLNEKEVVILSKREINSIKNLSKTMVITKVLFSVLFFICLFTISNYTPTYPTNMNTYVDLILTFLLPISVLGFINIQKIYKSNKMINLHKKIYRLSFIPVGIAIMQIVFFQIPRTLWKPLSYQSIGPLLQSGIYLICGAIISCSFLLLINNVKRRSNSIFFIFVYSGLYVMMLNIDSLLKSPFQNMEEFYSGLIRCIYPIPLGILLMFIVILLKGILSEPLKAGD